jgi:hypothetical protein
MLIEVDQESHTFQFCFKDMCLEYVINYVLVLLEFIELCVLIKLCNFTSCS